MLVRRVVHIKNRLNDRLRRMNIDSPDRATGRLNNAPVRLLVLYSLPDIVGATEKGKPTERWGRKASGLRDFPTTAGPPETETHLCVSGAFWARQAALHSKNPETGPQSRCWHDANRGIGE